MNARAAEIIQGGATTMPLLLYTTNDGVFLRRITIDHTQRRRSSRRSGAGIQMTPLERNRPAPSVE